MARPRLVLVLAMLTAAALNCFGSSNALNDIGVCYGMLGDNLPAPVDVVNLFKRCQIGKIRLFDPNPDVLNALRGSEIAVTLGVRNEHLPNIASSQDAANAWFATNVEPYLNNVKFSYIAAGNEVIPGELAASIVPAMQNLQNALNAKGLAGIKVTTSTAAWVLGKSDPPSTGEFTADATPTMTEILKFLAAQGSPLMINIYPYWAVASGPTNVMDYVLFNASGPVVTDGELNYNNMFDVMVDAFVSAMEKAGGGSVKVVVSESGWPSAGGHGDVTTPEIAGTYNRNLVTRITSKVGTPKRPDMIIEGFVFAMFNENLKSEGIERNFGLFYPNMQPVYPVF